MDEGGHEGGDKTGKAIIPGAPPAPAKEATPQAEEIMCRITEESSSRGREVTLIIADLTVGPDGCRGWAIYIG